MWEDIVIVVVLETVFRLNTKGTLRSMYVMWDCGEKVYYSKKRIVYLTRIL